MLELLGAGLVTILQWKYLLPLFIGTLAGVVGGALPGVTITMTIIVRAAVHLRARSAGRASRR